MVIDSIKTTDRRVAVAAVERHIDSPELLYVSVQYLDGVLAVEVLRQTQTATDSGAAVGIPDDGQA